MSDERLDVSLDVLDDMTRYARALLAAAKHLKRNGPSGIYKHLNLESNILSHAAKRLRSAIRANARPLNFNSDDILVYREFTRLVNYGTQKIYSSYLNGKTNGK